MNVNLNDLMRSQSTDQRILSKLRKLMPDDVSNIKDMNQACEKQANRLRQLLDVRGNKFPNEAIQKLPMIEVILDDDLPYSASARWLEHRWLITINGKEPYLRQRFSLAHEIKHIIDHKHKYDLYLDLKGIVHNEKAEQQADYFAACLLMPKDKVTRLFNNGITSPTILATFFEVSPLAMHIRLRQLKLTTTWQNCKLRIQYKLSLIRILMRLWHVLHYPEEIKL